MSVWNVDQEIPSSDLARSAVWYLHYIQFTFSCCRIVLINILNKAGNVSFFQECKVLCFGEGLFKPFYSF